MKLILVLRGRRGITGTCGIRTNLVMWPNVKGLALVLLSRVTVSSVTEAASTAADPRPPPWSQEVEQAFRLRCDAASAPGHKS